MQPYTAGSFAWRDSLARELAPSSERTAGALRTALAAVIATLLMLVLQTPWMALGCYTIFLVSYETPYLTFKTGATSVLCIAIGVVCSVSLIALTQNDPMARVLGLAVFTLVAAFFLRTFALSVVPQNIGIVSVMVLSLWDSHTPAEILLHRSMWPVATVALCVACKVAVEYLFTRRDPVASLQEEIEARFEALEQLFLLYGESSEECLRGQIAKIKQYAFIGQGKMRALLEEISQRGVERTALYENLPELISSVSCILDLAAAFAVHHPSTDDGRDHARLDRIRRALTAARSGHLDQIEKLLGCAPNHSTGELSRIEHTLQEIGAASSADHLLYADSDARHETHKTGMRWLASDTFSNPDHVIYAIKLSLCATLCYVIYNALDWPGISTAVLTVLIAGLSTTGATNQKMLFRLIGSTIGGVLLGLGCIVFVFPYFDTVTPFLIVVGLVSFLAAWVARSPHISYVGLQIAFSFFLIAFEGYSAPIQLEPARDRVVGIMLALVVMWLIYHQVRPERTVDKMRHLLVRILTAEAYLLQIMDSDASSQARSDAIAALRSEIGKTDLMVRTLAQAVPFEFGTHRERDLVISKRLQCAASSSGSLLLSIATFPHATSQDRNDSELREFRVSLAHALRGIAARLDQGLCGPQTLSQSPDMPLGAFRATGTGHIKKTLAVFHELEIDCRRVANACTSRLSVNAKIEIAETC